jgi:uncharacterized protein involved in exopolysaccharide biosynthesis
MIPPVGDPSPIRVTPRRDDSESTLRFLDLAEILARNGRRIAAATILAGLLAAIVSLILPSKYVAIATIFSPEEVSETRHLMTTLRSLSIPGVGERTSGQSPETFIAILESRRLREQMIQRFDLMKVYRAKRLDDALLLLSKRSSVRLENTGIISVTVEDRDRQRAADIANAMVEELDKINVEVRIYKARRARLHVESQLAATRQRLSAAEDSLAAFQAANLAIALDEQAKAAIEAVARLEAQAIELRVRKGLIESYATAENPEYRLLQKELSALEQQLGDVELTSATDLSFSKVPALAARLAQLVREVKVAETVLALLTEDYEKARLDEAKETPVVQVLDRAEPPERRAWPKRTLLVGSISAGVLVASIAFSIASDRLARFTSVEDRSRWTAVARHCGEWLRPRRRER